MTAVPKLFPSIMCHVMKFIFGSEYSSTKSNTSHEIEDAKCYTYHLLWRLCDIYARRLPEGKHDTERDVSQPPVLRIDPENYDTRRVHD